MASTMKLLQAIAEASLSKPSLVEKKGSGRLFVAGFCNAHTWKQLTPQASWRTVHAREVLKLGESCSVKSAGANCLVLDYFVVCLA